jgi:hypothetical protein
MLNIYNKSTIKDYNYAKLLLNKKVALVGPSSNTLNTKQLDKIESYDLIVRLNKTFEVPFARQIDIGHRTDILYNSMNTGDFPGQNDFTPELIDKLKKNNLKYIACSYPYIHPFDMDILKFIEVNESKIPYHVIDIVLYKYLTSIVNGRPYTGTCAIIDLLSYPIKELYITGIDCYLNKYYTEYRNIKKRDLDNLRHNHIHHNIPQLAFIKQLAVNDSRFKLDAFLENYFFKKEYVIHKKINVNNYIINTNNRSLKRTLSYINNLTSNKVIIYSFNNIQHDDIFLINNSLNYSKLNLYSDAYININNNSPAKNIQINNNIKVIFDLNQNSKILDTIRKFTDIKHILLIDLQLIQKIIDLRILKTFNIIFVNIFILCHIFRKILYIDEKLLNDLGNVEKNVLLYLQYLNKIKIIKL